MSKSIIAYDTEELEKKQLFSEAKTLFKSKVLSKEQYEKIRIELKSGLYSPNIFLKILLFIMSYLGMSTVIIPIGMLFNSVGETRYRILSVLFGIALIWFVEFILIRDKNHYKTGMTEAGLYSGAVFILVGSLGFGEYVDFAYLFLGFLFSIIIAVRYLDYLALIAAFVCFSGFIFKIIHAIGGITEALMPLIFFVVFWMIFGVCVNAEKKMKNFFYEDFIVLAKTISLLIIYASVNYYVVRELSESLMGLKLQKGQDIPYAFVFYAFTALLPIGLIYYGVVKRSVLFLRIGLLTFALSVVTFKYYFSLGLPVITFTVSGVILIAVSLWLLNYLKVMRNGFTRDNLMNDKWMSPDINAIIISQTLGGNKIPDNKGGSFSGGASGGAGATSNW